MDLFREIYFNKDGNLDTEGYSQTDGEIYEGYFGSDKDSYFELGMDENDRSKIVGRSAFIPKIIRVSKEDARSEDYRYFLTLDDYGKFNRDNKNRYFFICNAWNYNFITNRIYYDISQIL